MALDFDRDFPPKIADELNKRASAVGSREKSWNYKKYAWINIATTGRATSFLCPEVMSIGDFNAPTGGGKSFYTYEGGIRKHKPTLTSIKILNNTNSGDYVDAYIYEVEASFKVFTLADLDRVERAFFRIGAEVKIEFGWKDRAVRNKLNADGGYVYANIYNFSYALDDDGGYNCEIKAISPAALWPSEDLAGTKPGKASDKEFIDVFKDLESMFKDTFGVKEEKTLEDAVEDDDEGILVAKQLNDPKVNIDAKFLYSVINTETSYVFFNDREIIRYTTLGTLIRYINDTQKIYSDEDSIYTFEIASGGVGSSYPDIRGIGSADPTKFILPSYHANYGLYSDDMKRNRREANMAVWAQVLPSDFDINKIGSIAISIDYCIKVYMDMAATTPTVNGIKQNPKISDFFKKIFEELEYLTGGLVSLAFVPIDSKGNLHTQLSDTSDVITLRLVNRKTLSNPEAFKKSLDGVYTFKTLDSSSILRAVSLESDFTADHIVLASGRSRAAGSTNFNKLKDIYGDCGGRASNQPVVADGGDETPLVFEIPEGGFINSEIDSPIPIEPDEEQFFGSRSTEAIFESIKENANPDDSLFLLRTRLGVLGLDAFDISAYAEACKNYILKNSNDPIFASGRYSEIPFTLDLSVNLDGIWGIPLFSPISIDRLPNSFNNDRVKFSIVAVEHTFDGQGDWETKLNTLMRIV